MTKLVKALPFVSLLMTAVVAIEGNSQGMLTDLGTMVIMGLCIACASALSLVLKIHDQSEEYRKDAMRYMIEINNLKFKGECKCQCQEM